MVGALGARGAWRGFFREAFGMLGLLTGVAVAVWVGPGLAAEARLRWGWPGPEARAAGYAVGFVAPWVVCNAVGWALHRMGKALLLGGLDRVAGAALGLVAGVAAAAGGVWALALWPHGAGLVDASRLGPVLLAVLEGAVTHGRDLLGRLG